MSAAVEIINDYDAAKYIASTYFDDPVGYMRDIIGADPDEWQIEGLNSIANNPRTAVKSGHGVGKTCLSSSTVKWFMATRPNPQIIVTANTKNQLDTKTWRELSKWNQVSLDGNFYKHTATRFFLKDSPETSFASSIPWSENNSEAFAGTHEEYVLMLFDEASAIADIIWDVAEGAMTTPGAKWLALGNPTRNSGKFHSCFNSMRHRWNCITVDSRTAKMADKAIIDQWIEDYGEDSDFVRVRVKGEFPRAGSNQLIPTDVVEKAIRRVLIKARYEQNHFRIGVDVARFGDDRSVIIRRRGNKVYEPIVFRGLDTMELASKVVEEYRNIPAEAIFVDGVGIGAGVIDRLRQLGLPAVDVQAGAAAKDSTKYSNKRSEIWGRMADWFKTSEPDIPDHPELYTDLISPEYGYNAQMRIQLEKKDDMKRRGLASPDIGDALALTFEDNIIIKGSASRRNKTIRKFA